MTTSLKIFTAACTAALLAGPALAQDFPERGIELVAGYGPGGGHDTMLRTMARVLTEEGLVEVPLNVVNKDGGSSAVAMGYLNGMAGDGHYLMSVTSSHITTPLNTDLPLDYSSFTPIARLGIDPEVLVVNPDGDFASMDAILGADRMLNVGGTASGSIEHIVTVLLAREAGIELNFIPFDGDGEVVAALLSNQVDFAITNPGPVSDFIETGDLAALAISTEERIEAYPELPTFSEQGIDIVLSLFRGVTAPADISPEAEEWLVTLMTDLNENDAWRTEYLEPNSVVPGLLTGEEFEAYLAETQQVYREVLMDLGLID
ncbi:tripartite tricarboxylate transporter substrate binding protein [Roseibacterium beibuensis]|uniref:Tripartite tricarboxylate transporter substrate binding protein n=1 Tax=[Roseibacterium] beibuensis TaxID=1193142 RepID=A0ABP9KQP7_9RHOB|nr:tripartite tricarboxylate transporter substrate binding protein [Roseibacterium beibuensis]MCS6622526.1 tripartite tricarboxylate transporter substrate binding protein [Roseibacterium beibuensis]